MRLSLAVFERPPDPADALAAAVATIDAAAADRPDLVLLCEGALTGLDLTGDPAADLERGARVPGPELDALSAAARRAGAFLGLGFLTREGETLFDAGLLLDPTGALALHYRRRSRGWLPSPDTTSGAYGLGARVEAVDTPLGRIAMLLCGDLFDDAVVAEARALAPDLVLVPLARSFDGGGHDQGRWDREERAVYVERAAGLRARVLLVNELEPEDRGEGPAFGGALVVDRDGSVRAELPLGTAGILTVVTPKK